MQRLIAIFVIAIALTPNASQGAELGLGKLTANSVENPDQYTQSFNGTYSDEPVKVVEKKLSKKTEKVLGYMARAGIDGAGVKKITYFVNDRIEDDKFRIVGGEYAGFKMQLTHEISTPAAKRFELRLTNQDMPHWEMIGNTKGMMVNYKYEW